MTKQEFDLWLAKTESSRYHWTEDTIYRLNGRGAFYYIGGEDGAYIKVTDNGMLEAGTYEGAFPHIGEACFIPKVRRQFDGFNEAFKNAIEAGGVRFLLDMITASH